ncbi:shikimate O-hydroxycinnamoyltransferase-like [Tripterygium wilfordii]|uniref:Shikimate O-hydroxycinnamoyltransferase-like n=1 Tax=Tripterygium wilfordii TaxID=458696 RepID=A0A7J7DT58_TRIWF|nr:shikimate O-hydroxycinnamoyltransferase-like [Tripterygium wilfordii]KAF5749497.1 shikimate O-hydroxycinnamoyltransferase-like [Tripterygium wilfordii]
MEIQVRSSTMVRPAQDEPTRTLWSSNLDVVASRKHVSLVYFYRPITINGSNRSFFDTGALKDSLSKVLVPFYPLAGRLGWDPDGRIQVNCNGEGALFVEAYTTSAINDFVDLKAPTSQLLSLVPVVDYSTHISSYPLLLLQVTFFKCGGVCLGLGLHHIFADGTSLFHFMSSWAEVTRGHSVTVPPIFDHHLLRARVPPTPSFRHTEFDPAPSVYTPKQSSKLQETPLSISTTVLKITPHQLNTLRLRTNVKSKYSNYVILAAHIWRCMCKARGLPDGEVTSLYIPVTGRCRLNPNLPPGYFGNAIVKARAQSLAGKVQSGPFIQTVESIHQTIKRMDDDYLRSVIDYLEEQRNLDLVRATYSSNFKYPNLTVVSWAGCNLYDADFGWGRPIYVGQAMIYFQGAVFILPSPSNDGSLWLNIGLEADRIHLFERYFYGFDATPIIPSTL